jgi:glycosyltransferase involved in cell wall biosynthesis
VQFEADSFRVCERGIRIDSDSADDFLSGLLYLARDAGLRESLARRGEEYVKAQYSKERLVRDISSLYLRLLPSEAGSANG